MSLPSIRESPLWSTSDEAMRPGSRSAWSCWWCWPRLHNARWEHLWPWCRNQFSWLTSMQLSKWTWQAFTDCFSIFTSIHVGHLIQNCLDLSLFSFYPIFQHCTLVFYGHWSWDQLGNIVSRKDPRWSFGENWAFPIWLRIWCSGLCWGSTLIVGCPGISSRSWSPTGTRCFMRIMTHFLKRSCHSLPQFGIWHLRFLLNWRWLSGLFRICNGWFSLCFPSLPLIGWQIWWVWSAQRWSAWLCSTQGRPRHLTWIEWWRGPRRGSRWRESLRRMLIRLLIIKLIFCLILLISPWARVRGCFGAPRDIRTCGVENVNFEQSHTNVDCVSTKPSLKQPHRRSKPRPEKKSLFPRCLHGSKFAFFCHLAKPLLRASPNIVPAEQW